MFQVVAGVSQEANPNLQFVKNKGGCGFWVDYQNEEKSITFYGGKFGKVPKRLIFGVLPLNLLKVLSGGQNGSTFGVLPVNLILL